MPAPGRKSDGYVRGWHPDQRTRLPGTVAPAKKCAHPVEQREEIHNSNGDKLIWCALCDESWWEVAS